METETPVRRDATLKVIYWVAAAAMTISVVFEAMKQPPNWLSIASRGALVAALVLLATAKPAETRGKKVLIYALIAVALGLLIAKIVGGST